MLRLALLATAFLALFSLLGPAHGPVVAAPDAVIAFDKPNGASTDVTAEGDEFFSQFFGTPLNFNTPDDAIWPDNYANLSVANGLFRGRSNGDGSFFVLFPGFNIAAQAVNNRTGRVRAIPTARYSHLVVKITASRSTAILAYWMPAGDPYTQPIGNSAIYQLQAGPNIVDIDFNKAGGGGAAWTSRAEWGGLRLDAGKFAPGAGLTVDVEIDWIRLVPSSGGPTLQSRWHCPDGCPNTGFDLVADTDTNPSTGKILLSHVGNMAVGSAVLPVRALAPGRYYIGAQAADGSIYAYSPSTFTVQAAATFKVTSPGSTTGEDYASAVRGVPWDMRAPNSVSSVFGLANVSIANGLLTANPTSDDSQIFLINNDAPPIDTNHYKYFNYSIQMARPPGNFVFNLQRILWYNDPRRANATGDIIYWHDYFQNFSFDMRNVTPPYAATGWTGTQAILRLDPNESPLPPRIQIGPTTLTADPEIPAGQTISLNWQITSATASGTVSIFYDRARNDQGTQIAANIPVRQGSYLWLVPTATPPGTYWIRIVAGDGLNRTRFYSDVPLVVKGRQLSFTDVDSANPFLPFIRQLLQLGRIDGYDNGSFKPFADAQRGTVARWIVKTRGWTPDLTGAPHFSDVPPTHPDYSYIETAFNKGLISGYDDRTFRPNAVVTRGQVSKMVVNGFGWAINTRGGPHFVDVPTTNPFYAQIETIYNRGVVAGYTDRTFRWFNGLTRSQLAKILANGLGQPASK